MKKIIAVLMAGLLLLGMTGCSDKNEETTTLPPEEVTTQAPPVEEAGVPVTEEEKLDEVRVFLNRFYFNRAFNRTNHTEIEAGAMLDFAAFWAEKLKTAGCERMGEYVYIPGTVIDELVMENFGTTLPEDCVTDLVSRSGEEFVTRSYAYSDMSFVTVNEVLETTDGRGKVTADIQEIDGSRVKTTGTVSLYYLRQEGKMIAQSYRVNQVEAEKGEKAVIDLDSDKLDALKDFCTDLYMNPAFYNGSLGQVTDDTARLYGLYAALTRGLYREEGSDYIIEASDLHAIVADTFGRTVEGGYAGEARFENDTYRVDKSLSTLVSMARYLEFDKPLELADGSIAIVAQVYVGDIGENNSTLYTELRFRVREENHGFVLLELADENGDLTAAGVSSEAGEEALFTLMEQMFFSPAFGFCTEETITPERAEYFIVDHFVEFPGESCFADYEAGIMFIPETTVDRAVMAWFGFELPGRGLGGDFGYNGAIGAYEGNFIGRPSLYMLMNKTVENTADGTCILRADVMEPDWDDPEGAEATAVGELEIRVDLSFAQPRVMSYRADRVGMPW